MSENISLLEKPNQLYTNSQFFNSLPESYKLVKFKLLNSIKPTEKEADLFNDGIDEQANVLLREINVMLEEIDKETLKVKEQIHTLGITPAQKKLYISEMKKLAIREIKLFNKKNAIVAEANSLQIEIYF